ncbi:hypothetical protein ACFTXM_49560, partial [Streptomyces sp. NPDC056930]|uniref:hypothetical protein n=1 Tax=Streptomyces sp. NPDC056930 TaxID=3345967 RepID=UPI003628D012
TNALRALQEKELAARILTQCQKALRAFLFPLRGNKSFPSASLQKSREDSRCEGIGISAALQFLPRLRRGG